MNATMSFNPLMILAICVIYIVCKCVCACVHIVRDAIIVHCIFAIIFRSQRILVQIRIIRSCTSAQTRDEKTDVLYMQGERKKEKK